MISHHGAVPWQLAKNLQYFHFQNNIDKIIFANYYHKYLNKKGAVWRGPL